MFQYKQTTHAKDDLFIEVIYSLATGKNQRFRNPVGNMTKMLLDMRAAMPIEEYLEKISANFS
ncbi:MAG: hypothetical protein JST42_06995 [Bacteroidetes bacterium]|nr:hypothetical protein [Bacteroidota bacterium]